MVGRSASRPAHLQDISGKSSAVSEAKYRALYRLLAGIAGRYVTAYDEEALPVEVAKQAYEKFLALVKNAEQSIDAPFERQIEILNTVSDAELF
jgi:hypothetical protein